MSRSLKEYRVFCDSPGGLQRERKAFKEIIEIYNKQDAGHRGVHFVPVGWEIHCRVVEGPRQKSTK
jgi:hypothetical protein